jgi:choline-sulfatase
LSSRIDGEPALLPESRQTLGKTPIRSVALAVLFVAACGRDARHGAVPTRSNVLLITIDTLRADALGSYGHSGNPTPLMDRLASEGLRFDAAHAQSVLTLPSHASILTARYPFDHGVRDNAGFRLAASIDTLPVWLRAAGYRTGAFVSGFPLDERFGLAHGFDVYDDRLADTPRPAFLEQERAGVETVAHAKAWIDAARGQLTFCWVHLYEPHFPYRPPEPFASRFVNDPYEGEVAAADAALAPLLEPILNGAERGRWIIVLTGDHGEALGDHGEATHGIFAYESTLRVPLIVDAPGLSASVRQSSVRHVDIAPSILDLLGLPLPPNLDGRSVRLPSAHDEDAYFEAFSGAFNRGWAPLRGVVRGHVKYIDLPVPELYDLASDPRETRNLVMERPADADALKKALGSFPMDAPRPHAEPSATDARLRSLGYVSGGSALRASYTEADDPKRLIDVDRQLQAVVAKTLGGDPAGALKDARAIAAEHPKMTVAWLQVAHLARDTGDLDGGIAALRRAFAIDAGNVQVAALLGAYLTQANHAADAVALLTPLADREDADVEVLRALALADARTGATDRAVQRVQRARTIDPNEPQLLVDEGTVDLMANRRDAAKAAFEQALQRDPAQPRAQMSLGAMALDEGRDADAVAHWRAAVARDPSEYGRVFALGAANAQRGRPAAARTAFEFFVASAPPAAYAQQIAQARGWLASR